MSDARSDSGTEEALELADLIERSTGLIRMVPGEGTVQLGIKRTAMVIAALRGLAQAPSHIEQNPAGPIDWKMEAERANRLLGAQGQSDQDLGCLKFYIENMNDANWKDMRLHAERQLERMGVSGIAYEAKEPEAAREKRMAELLALLTGIIQAESEFREQMGSNWEGDPLSDAIDAARRFAPALPSTDREASK